MQRKIAKITIKSDGCNTEHIARDIAKSLESQQGGSQIKTKFKGKRNSKSGFVKKGILKIYTVEDLQQ